jgi:hypothetical protein
VLGFHPEGGGLAVLAFGGLYWGAVESELGEDQSVQAL